MASVQHPDDSDQPALFDAPVPPRAPDRDTRAASAPEQPALFDAERPGHPAPAPATARTHAAAQSAAAPENEAPRTGYPRAGYPRAGDTRDETPRGAAPAAAASETPWTEGPRACFDLETTGRDPHEARIVTASVVLVSPTGDVLQEWEWLADPGVEIPQEAAAVHGVSTQRARAEGRPSVEVVTELDDVLAGLWREGLPVLAFNAAYDLTVLARENERHGLPALDPLPVLDPFVLNKQVHRYRRGKRTLGALCEEYGVVLDAAHTSAADALATERLATALAERFAELRQPALRLHELQIGWAAEQAASLQEYFRRKDPQAVVDGTWPVHPRP